MLGVFFIEDYRFQVFSHMNPYETNQDWTALSTVHTYACRCTKVGSISLPRKVGHPSEPKTKPPGAPISKPSGYRQVTRAYLKGGVGKPAGPDAARGGVGPSTKPNQVASLDMVPNCMPCPKM